MKAKPTEDRKPLRNCSCCQGCGCPECLGTGFNINGLIKEYNRLFEKHIGFSITKKNYYRLPVVQQRSVSEYISDYIKYYNLGNNE